MHLDNRYETNSYKTDNEYLLNSYNRRRILDKLLKQTTETRQTYITTNTRQTCKTDIGY